MTRELAGQRRAERREQRARERNAQRHTAGRRSHEGASPKCAKERRLYGSGSGDQPGPGGVRSQVPNTENKLPRSGEAPAAPPDPNGARRLREATPVEDRAAPPESICSAAAAPMGGRAQGTGRLESRRRRRQAARANAGREPEQPPKAIEDGKTPVEAFSAWRPKYARKQPEVDEDEPMRIAPPEASQPYNKGWRLAKYVRACALNPDPDKPTAMFYAWNPGQPWAGIVRGQFFCKSWRCEWGCAEHEAHVLFARMKEAFAPYQSHELVFVVLTLDSAFHRLPFDALDEVYFELRARLEWLRKRLRRWLVREGFEDFENRWVSTIEQHQSGVPHVNLVLHAPSWATWLETRRLERRKNGQTARTAKLFANTLERRDETDHVLARMLDECGFGFASSAEQVRNKDEVIGYSATCARHSDETAGKLSAHFVRADNDAPAGPAKKRRRRRRRGNSPLKMLGELAKKRQLPTRAPKGFRRVRSGRGFLPPRQKGNKTGCILHHTTTPDGAEFVRSMTKTRDEDRARVIAMCEDLERSRAWGERIARENGELAAQIDHWTREVRDLGIMARTDEKAAKAYVEATKRLGELKRTRRRHGIETVPVPAEVLERFGCGPPRAPPARPPPGDPPRPEPCCPHLPGVA